MSKNKTTRQPKEKPQNRLTHEQVFKIEMAMALIEDVVSEIPSTMDFKSKGREKLSAINGFSEGALLLNDGLLAFDSKWRRSVRFSSCGHL